MGKALLGLVVILGCSSDTGQSKQEQSKQEQSKREQSKREPAEESVAVLFWDWFAANKESIASGMRSVNPETVQGTLEKVEGQLQSFAPGVSFLYGYDEDQNEFVATAHGDRDLIPSVRILVESAPEIVGWKFTAFRPPSSDPEMKIRLQDLTLAVSDVSFQGFNLGGRGLGITLYPTGMTEDRRDLYERAAVTLMDHTIGEYDAMVLIDSLRVDPLSEVQQGSETMPLTELREFLHEIRGLNDDRDEA